MVMEHLKFLPCCINSLVSVRKASDVVLKLPYFPVVDEMSVLISSQDLILLVSQEMRFQLLEGRLKMRSL